jgi:hypothetical protein
VAHHIILHIHLADLHLTGLLHYQIIELSNYAIDVAPVEGHGVRSNKN